MRTSSRSAIVEEGLIKRHWVGPEDGLITGRVSLSMPRTTVNRPLPSMIIVNLVDDSLNARVGIPTTFKRKYVYRVAHLQKTTMRTSSVGNGDSCQPTTADRWKPHTIQCEDLNASGSTTWLLPLNPFREVVESHRKWTSSVDNRKTSIETIHGLVSASKWKKDA
jgi:hypothetical protein